jgi:hypothetical protein
MSHTIIATRTVQGVEQVMEACGRCAGSGHYSFNLMHGTVCFGCNGRKGTWVTKADSERRAARRIKDQARRARKAAELAAEREALLPTMVAEFARTHTDLAPLADRDDKVVGGHNFLSSLRGQLLRNGGLSDNQLSAARRILPQELAKAARIAAERPQGVEQVTVAPEGRQVVTGTVVGQYTSVTGPTWARKAVAKMWVQDDRGFKISMSVPADLLAVDDNMGLTGRRVTLTVTVKRDAFDDLKAWGTVPKKASLVSA